MKIDVVLYTKAEPLNVFQHRGRAFWNFSERIVCPYLMTQSNRKNMTRGIYTQGYIHSKQLDPSGKIGGLFFFFFIVIIVGHPPIFCTAFSSSDPG